MFSRNRSPSTAFWMACLVGLLGNIARGDEGMFPMSQLAEIDLKAKGIQLTAQELYNPDATSLVDGVCRVNGCTGSFVSAQGLIITNHHCAYGAIQKASTTAHDYLLQGFKAGTLADEISAPDYTVRVTENYRDVSQEILAAVAENMSYSERTKAIEKRGKELEATAEKANPQLRAEVAEMFAGKTYVLFQYTYLKDIRLVFAPPQSIGNFGGEADNWMWPRHTGDFSFMRAYTAPDGSSATFAAENIPYQPKRFIKVAAQGVEANDPVFLLGYPGKTARHKTASFLQFEQDIRLPTIVDLYNWQLSVLSSAGEQDRAVEIKHASRMRSLANVEKRSRGQLQGLRRADIIATRLAQETELQAYIDAASSRKKEFGALLGEIDAAYAEIVEAAPLEIHLDQLRQASRGLSYGFFVVDSVGERQKADLDRESPYMDRNWEQSVQELQTSMGDYHAATDEMMLAGMLARLAKIESASEVAALTTLMADTSNLASKAQQLSQGTQLGNPEFVTHCLEKSPDELAQINDPLLQLAIQLYPTYLAMRELDKEREGRLGQLYGKLVEIKQKFLEKNFVPDANATLRFTSGKVRSYSPGDAIIKTPLTTFSGVLEKTTGVEPFITPNEAIAKYAAGEFGPFRSAKLRDIPVAILYDTDTTGGNSGSPVFNGRGELVGVNFDRCFEATINDFAWDQSYSRSIGVDIRYVLWITGIVYGADHLLAEMGVAGL